jgi:hypothetical protein
MLDGLLVLGLAVTFLGVWFLAMQRGLAGLDGPRSDRDGSRSGSWKVERDG